MSGFWYTGGSQSPTEKMRDKMTITETEIKKVLESHFRRFVSATQIRRDANGRAVIDIEFKSAEDTRKETRPEYIF